MPAHRTRGVEEELGLRIQEEQSCQSRTLSTKLSRQILLPKKVTRGIFTHLLFVKMQYFLLRWSFCCAMWNVDLGRKFRLIWELTEIAWSRHLQQTWDLALYFLWQKYYFYTLIATFTFLSLTSPLILNSRCDIIH